MLSHEEALRIFSYDQETGIFLWKISGHGIRKNKVVGSINQRGYVGVYTIRHKIKKYYASISVNREKHFGKIRETIKEAKSDRLKLEDKYHPFLEVIT